jgi:hypothetical protein
MGTPIRILSSLLAFLCLYATPVLGAGLPPKVRALPATNIIHNSAKLKGLVNPNSAKPTTVWFDWGSTTNLGRRSLPRTYTGTNWINVSKVVINLTPSTTHYYCLVASNKFGMRRSAMTNFTTAQAFAPIVTTLPVTEMYYTNYIDTYYALLLFGEYNTQGYEGDIWFEWGSEPAGVTNSIGFGIRFNSIRPEVWTGRIEGLRPNTAYYYRIAARNVYGAAYGEVLSAKTTPGFGVITQPAEILDPTSARLHCNFFNYIGAPTHLWFDWGLTTNYGNATVPKPAEWPLSEIITGLEAGTPYHFRPAVSNEFGVVYGTNASFTTP